MRKEKRFERVMQNEEWGQSLPAFFYRLSPLAQRCYLQSDSIDRFALDAHPRLNDLMGALGEAIVRGSIVSIRNAGQRLCDHICNELRVTGVPIQVRGVRPSNARGELHGIYYPNARPPFIVLWMRTAQRHDVVKPKTLARTLMHELAHHLDFHLFNLRDSFHTRGFFKRESYLMRIGWPQRRPPLTQCGLKGDQTSA
ncbi:MAG TPA: hypothetical protein VGI47_04160 [Candidatus Binataceae bacterium]